jgi:hypothetical protein
LCIAYRSPTTPASHVAQLSALCATKLAGCWGSPIAARAFMRHPWRVSTIARHKTMHPAGHKQGCMCVSGGGRGGRCESQHAHHPCAWQINSPKLPISGCQIRPTTLTTPGQVRACDRDVSPENAFGVRHHLNGASPAHLSPDCPLNRTSIFSRHLSMTRSTASHMSQLLAISDDSSCAPMYCLSFTSSCSHAAGAPNSNILADGCSKLSEASADDATSSG